MSRLQRVREVANAPMSVMLWAISSAITVLLNFARLLYRLQSLGGSYVAGRVHDASASCASVKDKAYRKDFK